MTDFILFKYRCINDYLVKSLTVSSIYFPSPENLNDPFDCQIDINNCIANALRNSSNGTRARILDQTLVSAHARRLEAAFLQVGICSFSLVGDHPLLWAHYANNHRGVCLAYRIPEEFFLIEENRFIGIAPVTYGDNTLRDWLREKAPHYWEPGAIRVGTELSQRLFTAKGRCWDYEKEIRGIRESPGALRLPREYLIQVAFGLRTTPEDEKAVRDCLGADTVEYCRVQRDGTDFGIRLEDIL